VFLSDLVNSLYLPRLDAAFESVTLALEEDHTRTVEDPVHGGIGNDWIGEYFAPFRDVAVASQDHRGAVFATVHQIEDLLGHFTTHRDHAPVIDDPQMRRKQPLEELIQRASGFSQHDLLGQSFRARAVDAPAVADGQHSDGEREVRFPDAGRAQEERDLMLVHELQGGELADLFFIDVRIEAKVEPFERRDLRKSGAMQAVFQPLFAPGIDFALQEVGDPPKTDGFFLIR